MAIELVVGRSVSRSGAQNNCEPLFRVVRFLGLNNTGWVAIDVREQEYGRMGART